MKKISYIFLFVILFIPIYVKAETVNVNSALLFKSYLSTGADIVITGDFTIDGNYQVNGPSTVDLKGHTIDFAGKTLLPYESLTIKDTSEGKTGKITGTANFLFQVGNSTNPGSLTIDGGTFECNGAYGCVRNFGTFNMNGGSLNANKFVVYNQKGTVEMNGGEIISNTGVGYYGGENTEFIMNDGYIKLTGDYYAVGLAKPGAKATINGGTIEALYVNSAGNSGSNCIGAFKDTELVINGGTLTSGGVTILGNGSDSGTNEGTNAKFTINGGILTSQVGAVIYAPQVNGITTITGGTLTGATGIEIRAGKLIVSGGTIYATAPYSVIYNTNGVTTKGAAISSAQHTTKQPIEIKITGGEFNGNVPVSQSNPLEHDTSITDKMSIEITNGTFTSTGTDTIIVLKNDEKFISGGTYTHNVTSHVVDGYGERDNSGESVTVLPYRGIEVADGTDFEVVGIDAAFPGNEIEVKPKDKKGYDYIVIVTDENGNKITLNGNKFIMPDGKVTIEVKYRMINNPMTGDNIYIYVGLLIIPIIILVIKKCKKKIN